MLSHQQHSRYFGFDSIGSTSTVVEFAQSEVK